MRIRRVSHRLLFGVVVFLVMSLFWGALHARAALAAPVHQELQPTATPQASDTATPEAQEASAPSDQSLLSIGNDTCLQCHGQPGLTLQLENGDSLDLYVPADEYDHSIHGKEGYACVQCHTKVGNYPHPSFSAKDSRDASLQLYEACKRCHLGQYEKAQDSVHAQMQAAGVREAAICTDCHTAHAVQRMTDPVTGLVAADMRTVIPQICANCHSAIYDKYKNSVHGAALIDEGNQDVPTCIDCHGVHNIENPTTAAFRLKSPEMCGKCHSNTQLMTKYGISTDVFNTYVADFHGTTVTLFEKESPDAPTNKAVCYDCHGIHDIQRVDDPQTGLQIKNNLLVRCRVCHPDATTNFPSAWLYHYVPSPENNAMVYYVNQFYKFFIPGVLGGMAILVVLDAGRLVYNRIKRASKTSSEEPGGSAPQSVVEEMPADSGDPAMPEDLLPAEGDPPLVDHGSTHNQETPPDDDGHPTSGEEASHG